MTSNEYLTQITNGALALIDDYPNPDELLTPNQFYAFMFSTEYASYLKAYTYIQYKGKSNYNADLDLYDIDLNKQGFDSGYYLSKDYQKLSRLGRVTRATSGRILIVSVNDYTKVVLLEQDLIPLVSPTATVPTLRTMTSFTANWLYTDGATGYKLTVAKDQFFTNIVTGYNNIDVGNIDNYPVAGLELDTDYYYKLIAYNNGGISNDSNIIVAPYPFSLPYVDALYVQGENIWRKGVRNTQLCWDVIMTVTGFAGVEDQDWNNQRAIP